MCFPACLRIYPQNKIYVHIYIYTLCSIRCFPCLQDVARLKIALNILAHVPKSLLDPDLGSQDTHFIEITDVN